MPAVLLKLVLYGLLSDSNVRNSIIRNVKAMMHLDIPGEKKHQIVLEKAREVDLISRNDKMPYSTTLLDTAIKLVVLSLTK